MKVGNGLIQTQKLAPGDYDLKTADMLHSVEYLHTVSRNGGGFSSSWPLWIYASIVLHFQQTSPPDCNMFIDGMRFDDSMWPKRAFFLKMDGPFFERAGGSRWDATVHISVDSKTPKSDSDANYKFRRFMGELLLCFTNINLYKLGDGPNDDSTFIDCLIMDDTDRAEIMYAGQRGVNQQNPSMASIDMKYNVRLKG